MNPKFLVASLESHAHMHSCLLCAVVNFLYVVKQPYFKYLMYFLLLSAGGEKL